MNIRERYRPVPMSANSTYKMPQGIQAIGGFLCTTGGSLSVTDSDGVTVVSSLAVTAGVYYPLPFYLGNNGRPTVVLSGGAAGTLGVG